MPEFHRETSHTSGDTIIWIRDAGWRRTGLTSPDGTHNETGAETEIVAKASGKGQALRLVCTSIRMRQAANLNDDSVVQKKDSNSDTSDLTFSEVDIGGVGNPIWTLSGRLNLNLSEHQDMIAWLTQMSRTRGYKELGVANDSTRNYMMIYYYNPTNHYHGAYGHKSPVDGSSMTTITCHGITGLTDLTHIHGRVSEVTFSQLGGDAFGWVGWRLTFIETL